MKFTEQSKMLTIHSVFWVIYYVCFGFVWAKNGDYRSSFFLEFVLVPMRMFCVYFTVLFLLPQFLLKKKFLEFISIYLAILILSSCVQKVFIHFFIDGAEYWNLNEIFEFNSLLRLVILINSTVLFAVSIYILKNYFQLKKIHDLWAMSEPRTLQLKSNKRTYNITEDKIANIEGLGNYVTYYLNDNSTIVVYGSLKETFNNLSERFVRVHKSHIINKNSIKSYSKDNIELLTGVLIPIGSSIQLDFDLLKK